MPSFRGRELGDAYFVRISNHDVAEQYQNSGRENVYYACRNLSGCCLWHPDQKYAGNAHAVSKNERAKIVVLSDDHSTTSGRFSANVLIR